jgi:hypothetical protein
MKKIPSEVIAVAGYSAFVDVGRRHVEITQFEPVNLLDYFSEEEVQNCESLKEALRQGWVVAFEGQKLPKRPDLKIKIPEMKVNDGSFSSAKIQITEQKKKGRKSDFDFDVEIPEKAQEKIEQAQADYKREKLEEKAELIRKQKEELEVDHIISTGKVEIPEINTIRVDGREVPIDYKAPRKGRKAVKAKTVKVDLENRKAEKEE